jgi:quinoprotein glucose dehydrogenase
MRLLSRRTVLSTSAASLLLARAAQAAQAGTAADTEWRHYAADLANTRYSPLDQIDAANFDTLEVAWRFKTDAFGPRPETQLECTPLLVKGRLFVTAGARRAVVSLDAATGEVLWTYRIDEGERGRRAPRQLSGRGVAYWTDGREERIVYVTPGYQMIALDAATGDPVRGFGRDGVVDLKQNIDQDLDPVTAEIGLHSAPTIANDVIVVGAAFMAGDVPASRFNPKGYVRGFDVRTGRRLWIFHTIPRKGEFGYDTWLDGTEGIGNGGAWAQISADEALNLAYVGVELAGGDYTGQYRRGPALFGESLVALDLKTGQRRWHYQFVHHGLWDSDIPCAAILCDIPHEGRIVKALAQPSKQGFLYVLNRETGEPIWPIVETPVEQGTVPGEWYSPTQPIPSKPPHYDTQGVTIDNLIDFTPALRAEAVALVGHYKIGPQFTPPSMSTADGTWGTLHVPGSQGGTNWPGGSYDPETHMVYVFSKTTYHNLGVVESNAPEVTDFQYVHGTVGLPVNPQRAMGGGPDAIAPRPPGVTPADVAAAAGRRASAAPVDTGPGPRPGQLAVQGLPLIKPPYGRITAIDLTRGDIAWQVAHGETPDAIRNHPALKGVIIPRTGQAANLGPLTTKTLVVCGDGGVFTDDKGVRGARLRAYDKATGEEKGAVFIPAPQSGSPMTYMLGGRQHIVVPVSGGVYSGEFIAFRLPRGGSAPSRPETGGA